MAQGCRAAFRRLELGVRSAGEAQEPLFRMPKDWLVRKGGTRCRQWC